MFKLKIIDKPEMFKMKCNFEFPKIPIENLQEKEVNPTTEKQEIVADKEYSALSKVMINAVTSDIDSNIQSYNIKKDVSILGVTGNVIELNGEERATTPTKDTQIITPSADKNAITKMTVNPIPDEYIIPSGEIEITENGNYNVTDKASARVIVPEKTLTTKTITANGTYNATDDNADGYSQVTVETSGVDINDYFINTISSGSQYGAGITKIIKRVISPVTIDGYSADYAFSGAFSLVEAPQINMGKARSMASMFKQCYKLETIPQMDTSNITNMNGCFYMCNRLTTVPISDTSKVTNMGIAFGYCQALTQIPKLNCVSVETIKNLVAGDTNLKNIGGFENLGQAYSTTQSANYSYYELDLSPCPNLTHDSLMNVINNLYDIATKGVATQQLILGSTNLAKLTAEEIQIATNKGFSVS